MRKTDKNIDKQLREVLTDVCESNLKSYQGFLWLTHLVNFSDFPKNLKVVCVFNTKDDLNDFITSSDCQKVTMLIQQKLKSINIKINGKQIVFDTEDNVNRIVKGNVNR